MGRLDQGVRVLVDDVAISVGPATRDLDVVGPGHEHVLIAHKLFEIHAGAITIFLVAEGLHELERDRVAGAVSCNMTFLLFVVHAVLTKK